MRIPHRPILLATLALLLPAARAVADDIVLTGGTRVTGVVLERTDAHVRVLLPSGGTLDLATGDVKEVLPDADAPQGERMTRYGSGPKVAREGLEVALIHYVHPETGRRVDLVGAVHIADMAYYREVQQILESDDVVLYELVKSKDADPEQESEGPNPIRDFQAKMARWFDFAFQLDGISYDRPHFIHADMTVEEFNAAAERIAARNAAKTPPKPAPAEPTAPAAPAAPATPPAPPTPPTPVAPVPAPNSCPEGGTAPTGPTAAPPTPAPTPAPAPAEAPAKAPVATKPKLPAALQGMEGQVKMLEGMLKAMGIDDAEKGPKVRRTVKGFLGRMLGMLGPKMGALLGGDASELLIVKRNEVVAERLAELPANVRTVAIFYGAAHLPDLEQRILAQGYRRAGARWLLAWDMSEGPSSSAAPR